MFRKDFFSDGIRFLIAGGLNTLLTVFIYQLCLLFMRHEVAYGLSWFVGIAFLITFYPTRVFPDSNGTWIRKALISVLYILNFVISLWLLNQVVLYGIPPQLAIIIALIYTTTINFFGMRTILRK